MKTKVFFYRLFCVVLLFLITACENDLTKEDESNAIVQSKALQLAKDYNFKLSKDNDLKAYKVTGLEELRNVMELSEAFSEKKQYSYVGKNEINAKEIEKRINTYSNFFAKRVPTVNGNRIMYRADTSEGNSPKRTIRITFEFDNDFPQANVQVVVVVEIDQNDNVIGVTVSSNQYGLALGSTFTQSSYDATFQNGVIGFEMNGQFQNSYSILGSTFTNTFPFTYTGYIQMPNPALGITDITGSCRQAPVQTGPLDPSMDPNPF